MMINYGRILVVDDDRKSRNILKRLLTLSNYEVETVTSGQEAVKRLNKSKFNLVLTDLDMPEMDGLALLSHVKSQYPNVSVIVVTGLASGESRNDVLKEGADGLLSKPYTRDQLLAIVSEYLTKKK